MSRPGVVRTRSRILGTILLTGVGLAVTGCGLQVPADPNGSLDRVSGGVLRAGASPDSVLVVVDGNQVTGTLAELVEGFAADHDADVEWTVGSEETLVGGLEDGRLDVAIGGMTPDSPWVDRAGLTRGYPDVLGGDGQEIVMLVPLGENRLLSALELYLDEELAP